MNDKIKIITKVLSFIILADLCFAVFIIITTGTTTTFYGHPNIITRFILIVASLCAILFSINYHFSLDKKKVPEKVS